MEMTKSLLVSALLLIIVSCKKDQEQQTISNQDLSVFGNYVTSDYSNRNEGYDWIAIKVDSITNDQIHIAVRSRADKKRPTCTFDIKAFKSEELSYEGIYNGKTISFQFTGEAITISTKNPEDSDLLYFFCSGGASLAGTYQKINEELDNSQIDRTDFSKVLNLQGIGFNVSSIKKEEMMTLSVFTFGLQEQEYNETFDIEGETVIDAEVEDLNSDGSPELFVYTQSEGSGSYGNVYAFSVNNNKSMSPVYFQPTAENNEINQGYMGHDEFTLIENTLSQRFPIYQEGDSNANPTGGIRQISYKLVDGEASRKLKIDQVTEY